MDAAVSVKQIFCRISPGKKAEVDMTQGNILRHIIGFAIPLLLGNLFQQLYNTVDTWVVGNYLDNNAFSAVGTVGPIMNLLIGFFSGLATGAGVVISQYYGAHRNDKVQDAVHTSVLMTLLLGVVFTALGIALVPWLLALIKMPEEVIPQASEYLTIYFACIGGLMIYNMGSGILRAIGDSRRPFYYLVVCTVMNIVLDLVFVINFNLGVAGVALATSISQAVSAVLVIITLLSTSTCVKLSLRKLKLHWDMLKKIITLGIPAALQMSITSFANIFTQSYINFFGADCMSGWTAYNKIDAFIFLPITSIAMASSTFVGQNLGSNQVARARKGVSAALIMCLISSVIIMTPVIFFGEYIVAFFNSKPEVVEYGTQFLLWLTPFYLVCCFNQVYISALRGAGNTKAPVIFQLIGFVAVRQIYLFIIAKVWNEFIPIGMSYPVGWIVCSLLTTVYYHRANLGSTRLVED